MSISKRAVFWFDDFEKDIATEKAEDLQLSYDDRLPGDEPPYRDVWARQLRDEEWSDKYHANVAAGILEP